MPPRSCYGNIESTAVLREAEAVRAYTPEHNYVALCALKCVNRRHLDLFERIIVKLRYEFFEMLDLCLVSQNDTDAVVGLLVVID